jgi:cytoskeletal protein RodZ
VPWEEHFCAWVSRARLVAAALLVGGAAALWLSSGTPVDAASSASATQTQSVSATVAAGISWGTTSSCTQTLNTAAFGDVVAGSSASVPGAGTGCVTSTNTWSVAVGMTTPLTNQSDSSTIDGSNIQITNVSGNVPVGAASACTVATPCTLPASPSGGVTIFTGAVPGAGRFVYNLKLNVPSNATGGAYNNGMLTFTASN